MFTKTLFHVYVASYVCFELSIPHTHTCMHAYTHTHVRTQSTDIETHVTMDTHALELKIMVSHMSFS